MSMLFKGFDLSYSKATPNVEVSEGVRPGQHFAVAPYLPLVRFDKKAQEYKVWNHGKVLAVDSNNYLTLAGLKLDLETAIKAGSGINGAWARLTGGTYKNQYANVYSATDVLEKVKDAQGNLVVENQPVVKGFFSPNTNGGLTALVVGDALTAATNSVLGTQTIFISNAIGIAPYDAWKSNGAGYSATNSAGSTIDYTNGNYSLQQGSSILTRYFIEVPVVPVAIVPTFAGLVSLDVENGTANGTLLSAAITYNAKSNFALESAILASALETGFTFTTTNAQIDATALAVQKAGQRRIGKVLFVDDKWPKDYMDYVRTWSPNTTLGNTAVAPGSATGGLPDQLWYAGFTGFNANGTDAATGDYVARMARINVIF